MTKDDQLDLKQYVTDYGTICTNVAFQTEVLNKLKQKQVDVYNKISLKIESLNGNTQPSNSELPTQLPENRASIG